MLKNSSVAPQILVRHWQWPSSGAHDSDVPLLVILCFPSSALISIQQWQNVKDFFWACLKKSTARGTYTYKNR
jgi:hypothetical protein